MATELDLLYDTLSRDPERLSTRLLYFSTFADTEFLLLLEQPFDGEGISPELSETESGPACQIFESETAFISVRPGGGHHLTISGRGLAEMLAGSGVGVVVNPGTPRAHHWTPEDMAWLATTMKADTGTGDMREEAHIVSPPALPPALGNLLMQKLAPLGLRGMQAWFIGIEAGGPAPQPCIVIFGADEASEEPIARSVQEAVTFANTDVEEVQLAFTSADGTMGQAVQRVGTALPLAQPPEPRIAPLPDPDTPPKLR